MTYYLDYGVVATDKDSPYEQVESLVRVRALNLRSLLLQILKIHAQRLGVGLLKPHDRICLEEFLSAPSTTAYEEELLEIVGREDDAEALEVGTCLDALEELLRMANHEIARLDFERGGVGLQESCASARAENTHVDIGLQLHLVDVAQPS